MVANSTRGRQQSRQHATETRPEKMQRVARAKGSETVSVTRIGIDLGVVKALNQTARLKGSMLAKKCPPEHPFAEEVQRIHTEWVLKHDLMSEEFVTMLNFKDRWLNNLHMCSPEEAAVIANYCAFFTIFDDVAEKYIETGGVATVKAVFDNFETLWKTGSCEDIPDYPKYAALKSCIVDMRRSILMKANDEQYKAFCRGMKSFHDGVIEQIMLSKHEHKLTATTQRMNRALNVAFAPTFEIMAIFQGVYITDEARKHPFFNRVYWTLCSLGGLSNDLVSFPKETKQFGTDICSQYHNYVSAVVPEVPDQTLQNAIDNAFEVHNSEFEESLKLGNLMCKDDPELYPFLETCLDLHSIFLYWCLYNPRYLKYCESVDVSESEAYTVEFSSSR